LNKLLVERTVDAQMLPLAPRMDIAGTPPGATASPCFSIISMKACQRIRVVIARLRACQTTGHFYGTAPNAVAVLRALVFGEIAGREAIDFAADSDATHAGQ
jgi:hypothetical protein